MVIFGDYQSHPPVPTMHGTKIGIFINDLSFTSYQMRLFAKERPHSRYNYRKEGTSPSFISEILLLIMNTSNFEGKT